MTAIDVDDAPGPDWLPLDETEFVRMHREERERVLATISGWLDEDHAAPRTRERVLTKARVFFDRLEESQRVEFTRKGLLPDRVLQ